MKPKSGKTAKPVPPAAPDTAEDADIADPGEMAEIKTAQREEEKGKYGSPQAKPHKAPADEAEVVEEGAEEKSAEEKSAEEETGWIEIELVGMDDEPIPGEKYRIKLPDDTVAEGTLDAKGFARVEGFTSGECKVCFPALDREAWEKI